MDEYLQRVIAQGALGSSFLDRAFNSTLHNCEHVEIRDYGNDKLKGLRIPEGYAVVVHSTTGNPQESDLVKYCASAVDNLVHQASNLGVRPIAFANVIDSHDGSLSLLGDVSGALRKRADFYKFAILNGENAILGPRINPQYGANVSLTAISIVKRDRLNDEVLYAMNGFDPHGEFVFINSDGAGTIPEIYERSENYPSGLDDSAAMKTDDASKIGAHVRVVSDIVETNGVISHKDFFDRAHTIGKLQGFNYDVQIHYVGERIQGYKPDVPTINVSGSSVSTISEHRLNHVLRPLEGNDLVAIHGGRRANGITDIRKGMVKLYGEEWHNTADGKVFMEFLQVPSIIFYNSFKKLIDSNLVTSVFHMSGGAFNGKLAKPLAKEGLFVRLENIFEPDWRVTRLANINCTSPEDSYAKWPMGNEGFVSTSKSKEVIELLKEDGLEAMVVGSIEEAKDGRTGVELADVKDSHGEPIYFSGN